MMKHSDGKEIIALVGQPNVGKSALMNYLTGIKTVVSNYPGTTVEVLEADMRLADRCFHVIDTPGTYTLHSDTEEQRVTQQILMETPIDLILNITDAANLDRHLYLTLQLLDFNLPIIVVLNQIDRARELGITIDSKRLSEELGVPVVPISVMLEEGLEDLRQAILTQRERGKPMCFSPRVETAITELRSNIRLRIPDIDQANMHTERTLAIHLLEHDQLDEYIVKRYPGLESVVESLQHEMAKGYGYPDCNDCFRECALCPVMEQQHPIFLTCLERTERARTIARQSVKAEDHRRNTPAEKIENIIDRPLAGMLFLLLALYLSVKGVILAITGTEELVTALMNPIEEWLQNNIALSAGGFWRIMVRAFIDGIVLPFSVVLPAMISVYIITGLWEDSGLLPRLSMVLDRLTRLLRLPGQAVIPFLLGFGCRAPAVLATRIMSEPQERFLVVALLSIVVPCAASLGIMAGVVAKFDANILAIGLSMLAVFLFLTYFLGRKIEDASLELVMEVPPLRLPNLKNILSKTWLRMSGFFSQVLPLMFFASVCIRILLEINVLQVLAGLNPVTLTLFGIPGEAFAGVAITVVQKYLAPMVLLNLPLTAREATIACAMVALSFPCLPVSILALRELGGKKFLQIFAIAAAVPIIVGLILNLLLPV